MSSFISLMQFDIAILDLLWVFDLIRNVTYYYHHREMRNRLDLILTGSLLLSSVGVAFVHEIILAVFLAFLLVILTVWCLAYVIHDQLEIMKHRRVLLNRRN